MSGLFNVVVVVSSLVGFLFASPLAAIAEDTPVSTKEVKVAQAKPDEADKAKQPTMLDAIKAKQDEQKAK